MFFDGLRNGKGKEYYNNNNNSKFIGEYLNDTIFNGTIYNYEGIKEREIKNGKGKIKEYDYNGRLIFKGEYLNGKRNGKGEEYIYQKCNCGDKQIKCSHNEKISIFKGEFLNGEKNGKGEKYNELEKLIFKDEFLNGYKNGIGEEFNENGNLIFKGEYLNGYKNGINLTLNSSYSFPFPFKYSLSNYIIFQYASYSFPFHFFFLFYIHLQKLINISHSLPFPLLSYKIYLLPDNL